MNSILPKGWAAKVNETLAKKLLDQRTIPNPMAFICTLFLLGGSLRGSPPEILVHPGTQIISKGGTAVFEVVARSEEPLSYRWRRGFETLAGMTNATLVVSNATVPAVYNVVVSTPSRPTGVLSKMARLNLFQIRQHLDNVVLEVEGDISGNPVFALESRASLDEEWQWMKTFALFTSPYTIGDNQAKFSSQRYYRAVLLLAESPPIENDHYTNRLRLSGSPVEFSGSTRTTTKEAGENLLPGGWGRTLWFTWQAPADGHVLLWLDQMNFPPLLGVYHGGAFPDLNLLAYSEEAPDSIVRPGVVFQATAGEDYDIVIDGSYPYGPSGEFTLHLVQSTLPEVSITSPPMGAEFQGRIEVTLTAEAQDADGIVKVEFFCGSYLIGTATTPPYSVVWAQPPSGTVSVRAKATDQMGAAIYSSNLVLTVHVPPPPNDQFANRIVLPSDARVVSGTTVGATSDPELELVFTFPVGSRTVWYSWTAPMTGLARIGLRSREFQFGCSVFAGEEGMPGRIDPLALWEESSNPVFNVVAGHEYFFRIAELDFDRRYSHLLTFVGLEYFDRVVEIPDVYPPEGNFSFEISIEEP
jgi:hypothetical protein